MHAHGTGWSPGTPSGGDHSHPKTTSLDAPYHHKGPSSHCAPGAIASSGQVSTKSPVLGMSVHRTAVRAVVHVMTHLNEQSDHEQGSGFLALENHAPELAAAIGGGSATCGPPVGRAVPTPGV